MQSLQWKFCRDGWGGTETVRGMEIKSAGTARDGCNFCPGACL